MWSSILTLALASPASSATVVLDGIYSTFKTGGSQNDVVDRAEARQAGNHVTFYRNGAVGQTTPIRAETATAGESYTVEGNTLSGAVTGTVDSNGDIVWSHGYTSRKQSSVPAPMDQLNKGGRAVIIVLSLIAVSLLTVSLLVIITLICKRRRARPLPVEVVGVQISALQISAPSAGTYDMRPNAAVQLGKGVV